MNLFRVVPSKDVINVALLVGSKVNYKLIVKVINRYIRGYVATGLARGYEYLEPGVYVASFKESVNENELAERLYEAFKRYQAERGRNESSALGKQPILEHGDVRFVNIPSTSYVVARLLNNAVEKIVHENGMVTHERPGESLSVCLSYRELEEIWSRDRETRDDRLEGFCGRYPNLCGVGEDGCSRFFLVLKCLVPRFQHVKPDDNREEIYLILHSYYRRRSMLRLSEVFKYLAEQNADISALRGVKVNYRVDEDVTLICDVESVKGSADGRTVVVLKCDKETYEEDLSDSTKAERMSLNPSYGTSRKFIANYLCRDFDKHVELSKRFPREYFSELEKDLWVLKKVIGSELCLSGVRFSIREKPEKVTLRGKA